MEHNLDYWQYTPENQYLDRKSARKKPIELMKHLSAFANVEGGQLVIGVEDAKAGNAITGFREMDAYPIEEFKKLGSLDPVSGLKLTFEEIPVTNVLGQEDLILIITVAKSVNQVIATPEGLVYLRQGDRSIKLTDEERSQLVQAKEHGLSFKTLPLSP